MPYKSKAQRGKFHILQKEGKISTATVHEFDTASKGMKLPEHVNQPGPSADHVVPPGRKRQPPPEE